MNKIADLVNLNVTSDDLNGQIKILIESINTFPEEIEFVEQLLRACEVYLGISLLNSRKVILNQNNLMFRANESWYAETISSLVLICSDDSVILYNVINNLLNAVLNRDIDSTYLVFEY